MLAQFGRRSALASPQTSNGDIVCTSLLTHRHYVSLRRTLMSGTTDLPYRRVGTPRPSNYFLNPLEVGGRLTLIYADNCAQFTTVGHRHQEIPGGPGGDGNVNATNLPNMVPWTSADGMTNGFVTVNGTFPAMWSTNSTTSIELTWPIVVANWIEPRCTVASISSDRTKLTLASPCGHNLAAREAAKPLQLPIYFEAAPGYDLAEGVFYHDRDNRIIYYNPRQGQTKTMQAVVAVQEVLKQAFFVLFFWGRRVVLFFWETQPPPHPSTFHHTVYNTVPHPTGEYTSLF